MTCFPLIRGRALRVTRLDRYGVPVAGPDNSITTEGFISVSLSPVALERESYQIQNSNRTTLMRSVR